MLWISLWDSLSISSWGNSTSFGEGGGKKKSNNRGKLQRCVGSVAEHVFMSVCVCALFVCDGFATMCLLTPRSPSRQCYNIQRS